MSGRRWSLDVASGNWHTRGAMLKAEVTALFASWVLYLDTGSRVDLGEYDVCDATEAAERHIKKQALR